MSDRRPEKLYRCEITPTYDEAYDPPEFFGNVISYPEATVDDLFAVVRRGVESGTIKGWPDYEAAARYNWEREINVASKIHSADSEWPTWESLPDDQKASMIRLVKPIVDAAFVIGPVSDGGSET